RMAAFDRLCRDEAARLAGGEPLHRLATEAIAQGTFWAASRAFDGGDVAGCQGLLEFASNADPGLSAQPEWARLRWKQRLGPRVWSAVRPLVTLLRRSPAPAAAP